MIIEATYKDVPFAEVKDHIVPLPGVDPEDGWEEVRGTRIHIDTLINTLPKPKNGETTQLAPCGGPFYGLADYKNFLVCIHILNVGD